MKASLSSLQNDFQEYLLGHSDRVVDAVVSTRTVSAVRRLEIYHNAYRARLVEVLMDTYERVVPYIGTDSFESVAIAYIESNPSSARSVRDYGGDFPLFLANLFEQDPDVSELAAMDQRLRDTFDAPDAKALEMSDVATLKPDEWEGVIFKLHPTVSLQGFRWNTPAIWQSLSVDEAPPMAIENDTLVHWLFWRKDLQPHFRSLSSEEHEALRLIVEGNRFSELCDVMTDAFPDMDVTSYMGAWLRRWLDDGIFEKETALSKTD